MTLQRLSDQSATRPDVRTAPSESTIGSLRQQVPALDGLRAVAVAAVIAYHLGLGWAGGGYLGVDLFFVLSGFLITRLLVEERNETGALNLPAFWMRRARRLLPALVVVVGAVSLYAAFNTTKVNVPTLSGDILSTLFYVANWHFIGAHHSYFAQFSSPSPLEHAWSLAIEEQFYVVWPLLLLALAKLGGRRWRGVAIFGTAGLAIASELAMTVFTRGATDISRAYFGTDTRAFELMIGALLALSIESAALMWIPRKALDWLGMVAMGSLVAGCAYLAGPPRWMFEGGFFIAAVLVAVVIASVRGRDRGPLGALLSASPIRWVGRISYGLYLWHWPVIVFVTAGSTGLPGWAVDIVRLTLITACATVSYYVVELPIRRRRLFGYGGPLAVTPVATAAVAIVLFFTPFVAARVPPSGATAPPPTPTRGLLFPLAFTPTASHPLRVLIIGDSIMTVAATGLEAALDSTGVIKTYSVAQPAWGLSIDVGWHEFLRKSVTSYKPDIVMGTFGVDGTAVVRSPANYGLLLDRAINVIVAPHNGVQGMVFLQYPDVAPSGFAKIADRSVRDWNAISRSEALRHPKRVGYLPVARWLDLNGKFAVWLPNRRGQMIRTRALDNYHLCPAGTARYASATVAALRTEWPIPAPVGPWWRGPWIHLDIFGGTIGGACPNDHPPRTRS